MSRSGRPQNDKKAKVSNFFRIFEIQDENEFEKSVNVLKNKMPILFLCYFEIHLTGVGE